MTAEYTSRLSAVGSQDSTQEKQRLQKELKRLDATINRFLNLYGDGRFTRKILDAKIDEINSQKVIIEERIRSIDCEVLKQDEQDNALSSFEAFCAEIRVGLTELVIEERQQLLRLLVGRVTIRGKNIRIELAIPVVDPDNVYRLRPKHPPPSPPRTRICGNETCVK